MEKIEKNEHIILFDKIQFLIGMGLFIVGIVNFIVFGGSLGSRYLLFGSAFMFQGPSYFFSVGLIPLILGLGFMIYTGLNVRRLNIYNKENQILISETYFYRKKNSEIPKEQILRYYFTNFASNKRNFLLLTLIPYFSFNFNNGIGNLVLNQISDVPITGTMLIISIFIVLILIIIYVYNSTWKLKIFNKQGYYVLKFSPFRCENQDLIIEIIKEKFKFVNQEFLKLKTICKNHYIAIGIVVVVISFYNIIFSHLLISFIENLNAWLAFYVGIMIIFRETKKTKIKNVEFLENERNDKRFKWDLILNKIGFYIIPLIISINCLLAIIYNWIGVFNYPVMFWRALISTLINSILISANIYYFYKSEIMK
ncbi:MAG: hypothetical protein ACTSVL_07130 [Promethearchaeota archaeon]